MHKKLVYNNRKIYNILYNKQLKNFTLNQKDENMNFITVVLKKLTTQRDKIKTL